MSMSLHTPSAQSISDAVTAGSQTHIHQPDAVSQTKDILKYFLDRLQFCPRPLVSDPTLRAKVTAEIVSWNAGLSPHAVEILADASYNLAITAYAHTPKDHQFVIAMYTAYWVYIDDVAAHKLEAVRQFGLRVVAREDQEDPVFQRAALQLLEMHEYFPSVSADLIAICSMDAFVGTYIEHTSKNMATAPGATRYPYFLRLKTGITASFGLFNFVKGWRDPLDNRHVQLLPYVESLAIKSGDLTDWVFFRELDYITVAGNDILSFYKELLAGETDGHIHMRATAEGKPVLVVLKELVDEMLDTVRKVEDLTANDPQLGSICRSYIMGFTEFHFRAKRYRLGELEIEV
ncbi:terpenoid synthase [Trametes meyenii]|nr:terpenoid synthase [Trametes meyenii]